MQSGAETDRSPEGVKMCPGGSVLNTAVRLCCCRYASIQSMPSNKQPEGHIQALPRCQLQPPPCFSSCSCLWVQTEDEVLTTMEELQEMDISLQILQVKQPDSTDDHRVF